MPKPIAVVWVVSLSLALPVAAQDQTAPAGGRGVQAYLNAPVWYVQYEVSLRASFQDTSKIETGVSPGQYTTTVTLDRFFWGALKLDFRTQGPGLTANRGLENAANMTQAQAMQATQAMLARFDHTAYWVETPPDLGDDASTEMKRIMEEHMVPARLDFTQVVVGENLHNELGQLYKQTTRTTASGSGMVYPVYDQGLGMTFEVDAAANEYFLWLPAGFQDMSTEQNAVKEETVVRTEVQGEPPGEERSTSEMSLATIPRDFGIDDAKARTDAPLVITGKLDPAAGRVTGEESFKAHFSAANYTVPATLVFRYTMTMTPPR